MEVSPRSISPLLAPALLLVALLGYLAGNHQAPLPSDREDFGGHVYVVSDAGLLLEYPPGWERASRSVRIPGLALDSPVSLTANGSAGATGLLVGSLAAGEAGPLPLALLARMKALPRTEVVELISTQAYRYSHVELTGENSSLTLYAIPATAVSPARMLACFSSSAPTPASSTCERIVAATTLVGPATAALTPAPRYAARVASLIEALDRIRLRDRRQMARSASLAGVAKLASALTARYSAALSSLSGLEAPQAAQVAQRALASALGRGASAYGALAVAAQGDSVNAYDTARSAVTEAEQAVDAALATYSLIGYGEAS